MTKKGSAKKSIRNERKQKKAKNRRIKFQILLTIVVVLMGGAGWYFYWESTLPGQKIENLGRDHVSQDFPVKYNNSPPTSGPHAGPASWGHHSNEVPEINQVHNLEHGGILIQYNCVHLRGLVINQVVVHLQGQSCDELRTELSKVLLKAREEIDRKIILAPYSKMPSLIAVTAWTRIQYFDKVEAEGILRFVEVFINEAPEIKE